MIKLLNLHLLRLHGVIWLATILITVLVILLPDAAKRIFLLGLMFKTFHHVAILGILTGQGLRSRAWQFWPIGCMAMTLLVDCRFQYIIFDTITFTGWFDGIEFYIMGTVNLLYVSWISCLIGLILFRYKCIVLTSDQHVSSSIPRTSTPWQFSLRTLMIAVTVVAIVVPLLYQGLQYWLQNATPDDIIRMVLLLCWLLSIPIIIFGLLHSTNQTHWLIIGGSMNVNAIVLYYCLTGDIDDHLQTELILWLTQLLILVPLCLLYRWAGVRIVRLNQEPVSKADLAL